MKRFVVIGCNTCWDRECTAEMDGSDCHGWGAAEDVCADCHYDRKNVDALRHPMCAFPGSEFIDGVECCTYCKDYQTKV
jgi:hypothetical protein